MKKEGKDYTLDFSDLLLLAIGSTIGAGVFVLLPLGIRSVGLGILFSLILASLVTVVVSLNYGELASAMPMDGGGYSWISKAFGKESSSFLVGWLVWLGNMGYAALSALGFSVYVSALVGLSNPLPLALAALLLLIIINTLTVEISIGLEKILTMLILVIFFVFWIYLSLNFDPVNIRSAAVFEITPIFITASLLYVIFIGFEAVSTLSQEAEKPLDLPKSFTHCVIIVTIVYMITSFLVLGAINFNTIPDVLLFYVVAGPISPLIMIAAIFATLTSLNAALIAASRNIFALARDEMMPKILAKKSKDFGTPIFGVLISGFVSAMLLMTNAVEYVASIAGFGYLICISLVCSSVILLRITKPKLKRPYKVPLYPYLSILGMILPLILIIFLDRHALTTGLVWTLLGFFVYDFYKILKTDASRDTKIYNKLRKYL